MSRQTAVSNQASFSHPEDALRKKQHSKSSQQPTPAHLSERNNVDVEESLGGVKKVKSTTATHYHDRKNEHEETLRKGAFQNRKHPGDAKEFPNGAAKARKAGPHGAQIDASGDNNAAPKKHRVAKIG